MRRTSFLLAALLPTAAFAQTEDAITVTATRTGGGVPLDLVGSSVTILDEAALQDRQARAISDILRDVPGVAVSRSGGVGGQTQVRLRGGEANHTLVLIDGIEASDPFQGEFDFATLIADDVARIEVLRGPQSALYGSDAIGGVIHYITATGADAPGVRGRVEGGSFGTVQVAARVAGVSGGLDYALSGAFDRTDGTPTAREGIGDRDLDAENGALSAKLAYALAPNLRLKAVARYSRTEAETNQQDFDFTSPTFGFVVDGDGDYRNRALYGLVRAELDLLDGRWTHAATAQINDTERRSRDFGLVSFATDGERLKGSYDTTLRFGGAHALTFAADVERERFRNLPVGGFEGPANDRRQADNVGLVASYDLAVGDRIGFGASVRHDDNDRFDDATTARVRGSVAVAPGVRLRAAAGSGIKNPTNFELFGFDPTSFVGNPDLKPERSTGWEAGADLALADDAVRLGATWFDATLKDEIFTRFGPGFVSSPANRDTRSKQHGVELFANARIGTAWRIDLAYTWLDAEEDGVEEIRRAPHIASANLTWRGLDDRLGVTATARYNGRTRDSDFATGQVVRLDDFLLANFAADYRLTDTLDLFGRVENLFDADYEEVFTYRSPGRAAFVGVRAGF